MEAKINDTDGAFISVEAGVDSIASDGSVRVYAPANELAIPRDEPVALLDFTPTQARELAAALLRAADEAEGVDPVDVEQAVRNKVAAELETLPTYNDIADWLAHIGRRQAINTARNGLRKGRR